MNALFALAAALPRLQVSTAASFDHPTRLDQAPGAPDVLGDASGIQVDVRVWLEWDLARLLDDPPGRGLSPVRRAAARQRVERAIARAALARRMADARHRLAGASTALDAASAILDVEEARASRPEAP